MQKTWKESDLYHNQFIRLLLIAIIVRVLVMPFFGHIDVLSEARRVYYWSENGIYLDNIARNTTMFIQVLFFKFTSLLMPDKEAMFTHIDIARTTASIPNSFEFVSHFTIFRTLFLLKLPFLVFDLLTAVVLFKMHDSKEDALASVKLWLFNPVTIFSFYIFGRFEAIPVFFIAFSLLAVKQKRYLLSVILLGLCINSREMMNIYLPVYVVALIISATSTLSWRSKLAAVTILVLSTAISLQLFSVFGHVVDYSGQVVSSVMGEQRVNHLFAFDIHGVRIFTLLYTLIIMWVWISNIDTYNKILLSCALAIMSFFAFSSHTAHFTAWMILFPAIYYGNDRTLLKPFIAFSLVWIGYWLFLTDLGVFTFWLAAPFSLQFTGIPNIPALYNFANQFLQTFDLGFVISIFKTFLMATMGYLAYLMIRVSRQQ